MKNFWHYRSGQLTVLVILGAMWGASFIFIKQSLKVFNPFEAAAIRISLSALILGPLVWSRLKNISLGDWKLLLAAGFFGNGLPAFLWAGAQQGLDSAFGGLLNATTPIFTFFVSLLFFRQMPGFKAWMGLALGVLGMVVFFMLAGRKAGVGHFSFRHALMGVGGAACYGVSLNIVRHRLRHLPPFLITGTPFIVMGVVAAGLLLLLSDVPALFHRPHVMEGLGYLLVLSAVASGLGVWLFNHLIRHTGALFASTVTYLIPLFALLWGSAFGEPLHVFVWPVLALIFSGIFLIQRDS